MEPGLAAQAATAVPGLGGLSSYLVGAVFVVAMTAAGFLLGRVFGNRQGLLDSMRGGRSAITDETRRFAKEVVAALEEGGTSEHLFPLLRQLNTAEAVHELFGGAPLDALLSLVNDLSSADKDKRPHGDQLLRLLARIASYADDDTRMRILGAMIKVLPRYRHATPFLVEISKRVPDAWNDVQPSLEEAASRDPAIARYLRDAAGPQEAYVRQATELYMTSMVRFRRLNEDRASGAGGAVDNALRPVIEREFRFLRTAGTVSRRFVWLPAQAHRFHPLVTDEQLDLLLREAPSGLGEVHALLGQLALAWALEGSHAHRVKRIIAALEDAAQAHPSAADALLAVFMGLKSEDAANVRPDREEMRRRAYFALLAASERSFEVIKLLGAHGIPRDLYQGRADMF
ncbi:MAG: hypothetical protein H6733_10655 [Alphaproteobacteria bacterium]|nr:hypothetical protein [Alphaproteobacteria bacterium]